MSEDNHTIDYRAEILEALDQTIASYKTFVENGPEKQNETKTESATRLFQDHHVAAKAAIAHVEMLLKAARLLGIEIPPRAIQDVNTLVAAAEAESRKTARFDDHHDV